jgi:hypothetical protein
MSLTKVTYSMINGAEVSVLDFGAVGDGVADDTAAFQAAIDYAAAAGGGIVQGNAAQTYRITSGLVVITQDVIIDLGGGALLADFASGWAVTIGDGINVTRNIGIRNGYVYTASASISLNGIRYRKNVRYQVAFQNLRIESFKGTGMQFDELNWSLQGGVSPMIRFCGVGLVVEDNTNAISIVGAALDDNDTYNLILRGTANVTVIGGYNQFAGTAGVLIDTGTVGSMQDPWAVSFISTYFEGNGGSHIIANNGRGLVVNGCLMNCNGMTDAAIKLASWVGAKIESNVPANLSAGTQRDFVEADALCTLIDVGVQNIATQNDAFVCVQGGSVAGLIGAQQKRFSTLPTPNVLTVGSTVLKFGAGTDANRAVPYMVVQPTSGAFEYRRVALSPVKQPAANPGGTLTPSLNVYGTFDITVASTGLTINAPTGEYADGDQITFLLQQTSTGGGSITWDAAYATDYANTGNTSSRYASVAFRWSEGRSKWIQTGRLGWTA